MIQDGKINSKLHSNTATYIVNPETLRATKKSLTSTPKTLDCEAPVNINSDQLASPPSTPTISTPNAVDKNVQEPWFGTDSGHPFPSSTPTTVTPKNTDFHADYLALKDFLHKWNLRSTQQSNIK